VKSSAIGVTLYVVLALAAAAPAADFQGLGLLYRGNHSYSSGVSADGSVVVGWGDSAWGDRGFYWTQTGGIQKIDPLPGGSSCGATGVSADGTVIVGTSIGASGSRAYRWTVAGPMQQIDPASGDTACFAWGVSADGLTVVGSSFSGTYRPARFTQGGGTQFQLIAPLATTGDAWAASANGSVIVGQSNSGAGWRAFRWTQAGGAVELPLMPGAISGSAKAVSADGGVVVGYSQLPTSYEAFRWTAASGTTGLGHLPGGTSSEALGVSADGSIVVGVDVTGLGQGAFVWDAHNGMRNLGGLLVSDFGLGSSLTGWTVTSADVISADGLVIVGSGTDPDGKTQAWRVNLDGGTRSWRTATNGAWEDLGNWTPWRPGPNSDVVISPSGGGMFVVAGPKSPATVKSLTIGGSGGALPILQLIDSALTVTGALTIEANGTLSQFGGYMSVNGQVANRGTMAISGFTYVLGSAVNDGTLAVYGGGTFIANGGLTNRASVDLQGGTIGTGWSGPSLPNPMINDYGASFSGRGTVSGDLLNRGTIDTTGPLYVNGYVRNEGTINVHAGQCFAPWYAMENTGVVNLTGGGIAPGVLGASVPLTNSEGGILRGDGSVSLQVTNQGGLIHANGSNMLLLTKFAGNFAGGELRVEDGSSLRILGAAPPSGASGLGDSPPPRIPNQGSIVLKGANATLSGDTIYNFGIIQGQGRVSNPVTNSGTIRAQGGPLTFSAAGSDNTGTIEATAGSTVLFTQGLISNDGLVSLTGGTFDNNNVAIANVVGSILGHGRFSSGGLTNLNMVAFADGNTDVFGPVSNTAGAKLYTYGTPATVITFYGYVSNAPTGDIHIYGGTVRFLGGGSGLPFGSAAAGATNLASGNADLAQTTSPPQATVAMARANGSGTATGITVDPGATLELAPSDGSALTVITAVHNNGSLNVATANQQVGTLDGIGTTSVAAGADLSAECICQSTLEILSNGEVTIRPYTTGGGAVAGAYASGQMNEVPEPATLVLLGMAGLGLLAYAWRRRKAA